MGEIRNNSPFVILTKNFKTFIIPINECLLEKCNFQRKTRVQLIWGRKEKKSKRAHEKRKADTATSPQELTEC